MQEIRITRETAGGRLDKTLFRYLDKAGSGFIYRMLRKKNILLNGKRAAGGELLREGDCIRLYLSDETIRKFRSGPEANRKDLSAFRSRIIYEDADLLAVSKPQGLLSQKAAPSDISLNEMIKEYLLSEQGSVPGFAPGIANRLDRNTSGLVLAGKNPAAQRSLSQAIQTRTLQKYYLCIVHGHPDKGAELSGYLLKDPVTNQVRIRTEASAPSEKEQWIRTSWEVLRRGLHTSLLKVELITGRAHQIRAHLASQGYAIVGDGKYGDTKKDTYFRERFGVRWQLLHAYEVRFVQMTGVLEHLNGTVLQAPVPERFQSVAREEGLL